MSVLQPGRRVGRYTLQALRDDRRAWAGEVWDASAGDEAVLVLAAPSGSAPDVLERAAVLRSTPAPGAIEVLSIGRLPDVDVVVQARPPGVVVSESPALDGGAVVSVGVAIVHALAAGPGPSHPSTGRLHAGAVWVTEAGATVDLCVREGTEDDRVALARILRRLVSGPELLSPSAIEWKLIGLGDLIQRLIDAPGGGWAGWSDLEARLERLRPARTVPIEEFVEARPSTSTQDWSALPAAPSTKTQDWSAIPEAPSSSTQDWSAIPEAPSSSTQDWSAIPEAPSSSTQDWSAIPEAPSSSTEDWSAILDEE